MNFVAAIILSAVGAYVGFCLREQMRHRVQMLSGVHLFATAYISNLSYLQLHLPQFVSTEIANHNASTQRLLNDFLIYLQQGAQGQFYVQYAFLENVDKQLLSQFFTCLGKGNSIGQHNQAQQFCAVINTNRQAAQTALSTKGNMIFKLGTLLGLALGVVVI